MEELKQLMELEDNMPDEFDMAISNSHEKAELLTKKGYKVKLPIWKGLIAS
tara:strand:+ start:1088 stop:1240 length:153 start_codon:yes stop_codon:yes gene_type:complete